MQSAINPNTMKNTDIIQNIPVTNSRIPAKIPSTKIAPLLGIFAAYNMKILPANSATIIGMNGNITGVTLVSMALSWVSLA